MTKFSIFLMWVGLVAFGGDAHAQTDPMRPAFDRAVARMGADRLDTIEYEGAGISGFLVVPGQAYAPGEPWPQLGLKAYKRQIDYVNETQLEDFTFQRLIEPARGGGLPLRGEMRYAQFVAGGYAWNRFGQGGDVPQPRPYDAAARTHDLWITPHGILRMALASRPEFRRATLNDAPMLEVSVSRTGILRATAFIDARDLVVRVDSVVGDPLVGEAKVQTLYEDYDEDGGVAFPRRIRQTYQGFPMLDLTVVRVKPNAPVDIPVPAPVRSAQTRVVSQLVAPGVWYLTGGTHHSVLIERAEELMLVDAPQFDGRSLAIVAEAARLASGKRIRTVVNTHIHTDHSGGLRAFVAEGAAIVTHAINAGFLQRSVSAPSGVTPDHLAKAPRAPIIVSVRDREVWEDGPRRIEAHHIRGNAHNAGMLMVYLPIEKILIEADVYSPGPPGAAVPVVPNHFTVNLADNVARLGLAVERILPMHGRVASYADMLREIGRAP